MRAAEIGRRRNLARFDDAAADRARSCEMIEQGLAVAAADRARQLREVFVEGAEHFQHRVLVGEEHVPPHGRIGRRDAGEIAKAAGGKFEHFRARHLAELVGGADDRIGDQVRQMTGDRQHQIVVRGRHRLRHWRRARARTRRAFSTAAGSLPSGGVRMHQRPTNSSAKPASGPEILGAGDRMRRNKMNAGGQMRAHVALDRALDRADVGNGRPGARCGPISLAISPHTPTGAQTMTRSAPATAAALVSTT